MTTYAIFDRLIVDADREPLAGATVTIQRESDLSAALTYSDRAGTTPTSPQGTLTSDSGGRVTCYMPGGAYKVTVSKDAFSETFRYVAHGTAGEYDYTDEPEYVSVRFAPTDETPDAEEGVIYYPNAASQFGGSNSSWVGPGPYARVPMSSEGQSPAVSTFRAIANTGLLPSIEKTANTSITQFDGGRVLVMNSPSDTNVTFPADVLRSDQVATLSGSAPGMKFTVVNRGVGTVNLLNGSGVSWSTPGDKTVTTGRAAVVLYIRTGSGTALLVMLYEGDAEEVSEPQTIDIQSLGEFASATETSPNLFELTIDDFDMNASGSAIYPRVVEVLATDPDAQAEVRLPDPGSAYLGARIFLTPSSDQTGNVVIKGPLRELETESVTFSSGVSSANIDTRYMRVGDLISHPEIPDSPPATIDAIDVVSEAVGQITSSAIENSSTPGTLTVTTNWADFTKSGGARSVTILGTKSGEEPIIAGFIPHSIPASGPPVWRITDRSSLRQVRIDGFDEAVYEHTAADTSAIAIDLSTTDARYAVIELEASPASFTLSGAAAGRLTTFAVKLVMDGSGSHTWAHPTGCLFPDSGTPPTIDDAANGVTFFTYLIDDDGTYCVPGFGEWSTV